MRSSVTSNMHFTLPQRGKKAIKLVVQYPKNDLITPIIELRANLASCRRKNCCLIECNFPQRNALCVGARVMLLKNFGVEEGLYNGAIGDLKSLNFEDKTGPLVNRPKGYAIVDFPACPVPENKRLLPGMPSTCISVYISMVCCKTNTVPWRRSLFGFAGRLLATQVTE